MKNVWYQLKRLGKASLEETMCFLRGEEGVGTVEVILILVDRVINGRSDWPCSCLQETDQ